MPSRRHRRRRALISLSVAGLALTPTGVASAHARTAAQPVGVATLSACPVDGDTEFVDDWGDARSGGRRHQGVDMVADRGTPVVAVRDGDAEFKRSNLGGNAIWLVSATGERFYYAHLDRWAGTSRTVTAGEVIGYVGSSGNARGTHLHFESRVGQQAVNPYPLLDAACRPSTGASPTASHAVRGKAVGSTVVSAG
jgi:murein DD-endopeptidase MepM/ murein hydrolase activator NlpD